MSDKVKLYSRTGYGEWNEKVVGKAKQFCVLCRDALDVLYKNGIAIWTDGHNAEPMSSGRCCNYCNDTKVIPARIRLIAGEDPKIEAFYEVLLEMDELMSSVQRVWDLESSKLKLKKKTKE